MNRKTLVLGASENPERYSNLAIRELRKAGEEVVAVGAKQGKVGDVDIVTNFPTDSNIHTVSLYLNPEKLQAYIDPLLKLKPTRIIFNPGTEQEAFAALARKKGIQVMEACTLVLLRTGQYADELIS